MEKTTKNYLGHARNQTTPAHRSHPSSRLLLPQQSSLVGSDRTLQHFQTDFRLQPSQHQAGHRLYSRPPQKDLRQHATSTDSHRQRSRMANQL